MIEVKDFIANPYMNDDATVMTKRMTNDRDNNTLRVEFVLVSLSFVRPIFAVTDALMSRQIDINVIEEDWIIALGKEDFGFIEI